MAIASYSQLIVAGTEWLARDQDTTLINRLPDLITLAEAKFNRELFVRQMEVRATAAVDITTDEPEFISLPTDFQSMRRIRLSSVSGKPRLEFKTGAQIDDYRSGSGNSAGQPRYFSILGSEIELAPTSDANYTIEMVYRATIQPLNVDNTSNWLLTMAPDLYLYGMLLEAMPYIQKDSRIQTWLLGFTSALDGLNRLGLTSTFNAGPMRMQTAGATP